MDSKLNVLSSQMFIKAFAQNEHISDEVYNKVLYTLRTGRIADVRHPKTFNEHVLYRKIFADESGLAVYTDKYTVRDYVRGRVGEEYLVKNYGVWSGVEEINFQELPDSFMLKATHGSGWNVVVKDKDQADWSAIKNKLRSALKSNYYYKSRERNYRDICPRIICEELLTPNDPKGLIDFKLFCFEGAPQFVSVAYIVDGHSHFGLYTSNGEKIVIQSRYLPIDGINIKEKLAELVPVAQKLAEPFPFVRVDFYLCDNRTYFSELTFHSGGGIRPIEPHEVDVMLGSFFEKASDRR